MSGYPSYRPQASLRGYTTGGVVTVTGGMASSGNASMMFADAEVHAEVAMATANPDRPVLQRTEGVADESALMKSEEVKQKPAPGVVPNVTSPKKVSIAPVEEPTRSVSHSGPPVTHHSSITEIIMTETYMVANMGTQSGPSINSHPRLPLNLEIRSEMEEELEYEDDGESNMYQIWVASCSSHCSVATVIDYCGQFVRIEV